MAGLGGLAANKFCPATGGNAPGSFGHGCEGADVSQTQQDPMWQLAMKSPTDEDWMPARPHHSGRGAKSVGDGHLGRQART